MPRRAKYFNKTVKSFPFFKQLDQMDCGPTCIRIIAKHYGKDYNLAFLRAKSFYSRSGVSLKGIMTAAESIGFRTMPVKLPFLPRNKGIPHLLEAPVPVILHWNQHHFVVLYKITRKFLFIADPAQGKYKLDYQSFRNNWISEGDKGVALLLEPTPEFYQQNEVEVDRTSFWFLLKYLLPYKRLLFQFCIGLGLLSLFQLIFPFLTQALVDYGIANQDIGFVYLILIAQLMLFLGQTSVSFIQNWILLHVSTRLNVALISDFLIKLMKLPMGYFDTKMVGDLLQRIGDHSRIESFLTTSSLSTLFSLSNLVIFSVVLFVYNALIFFVFLLASIVYILWILFFLKKRKEVDYEKFRELSLNQSSLIELIQGMQEIKLQNSEKKYRKKWANIQARLFKANIRSLAISQYQDAGGISINQLKDIVISFVAAKAVINGQMTLGMMMAIQYIVGQLNGPLQKMIQFVRSAQDAQISLERLGEIHKQENEETPDKEWGEIPEEADLLLDNVTFRYNAMDAPVLEDISLKIPHGKTTAIVGTSGSGKTTLIKLLLGFYEPTQGNILVGQKALQTIDKSKWRNNCGSVMQDGFIFSDTIANNIAGNEELIDRQRLVKAVQIANIKEYIEELPLAYDTIIGARGNGMSRGQIQRLLIARAIYKEPAYVFFDEATNALDAKNEKQIVENLNQYVQGKTVVVIAHRLSTVKHADQIVVIEKGKLLEIGSHQNLIDQKGFYYGLVKNQLELGN